MAIVDVRITFGRVNATLQLDSNVFSANTWERLSGTRMACPSSGEWARLGRGDAFMNDSSGNSAMILESFIRLRVGNTGAGLMQATGFVIPENGVFDWEVTRITEEWYE